MSDYTFLDALSTPVVGFVRDGRVVYKTDELRAKYETRNPNPLQARRAEILDIFQNEPLDKTAALALIDELAEIETGLQWNHCDPTGADWFDFEKIEEIEF